MRSTGRCTIGLAAVTALAGCLDSPLDTGRVIAASASEVSSFQLEATGVARITVDNVTGFVRIVGDPAASMVLIDGTRQVLSDTEADARQYLESVSVEVLEEGDEIGVRTVRPPNPDGRQVIVDLNLTIPSHLDVEVTSFNGDVTVASLEADVRVDLQNGVVRVQGVVGDATVTLANGGFTGDVAPVPDGHVDVAIGNGDLNLDLPDTVSAILSGQALNGTISVTGLTVMDELSTLRTFRGRLGDGNGLIELNATNGDIVVRGRPSGP